MTERFIVRTPFATRAEFIERFRRHFRGGGVFIPARELPAVGEAYLLEVQGGSGSAVFSAEVVTAWIREEKPRGVGFRILRAADKESERLLVEVSPVAEIIQLADVVKAVYERREVSPAWTSDRFAAVDRALDEIVK